MERHKFWIFLGLALAFGLSMEMLKRPRPDNARLAGFAGIDALLDEGAAVYIPQSHSPNDSADTRLRRRTRNNKETKVAETAADEKLDAPAQDAAKVDPKAQKDVKKTDKKTDKKKKKKKKAKKKTEDKKVSEPVQDEEPESDKKKPESEHTNNGTGLPQPSAPAAVTRSYTVGPTESSMKSAKEWESYLLTSPDMGRTEKFIKAYQSGLVTADTFYTVVGVMLDDSRPEMKQLGVMALGANPSARSFSVLVTEEHSADTPAKLHSQILVYLRVYTLLQNIKFLAIATASPTHDNPTAAYEAIGMLQTAANTYLRPTANQSSSDPNSQSGAGTPPAPQQSRAAVSYFRSVLVALQASEKWPDPNVSQAATAAYANISAMMPPSNANPATSVASTNGGQLPSSQFSK